MADVSLTEDAKVSTEVQENAEESLQKKATTFVIMAALCGVSSFSLIVVGGLSLANDVSAASFWLLVVGAALTLISCVGYIDITVKLMALEKEESIVHMESANEKDWAKISAVRRELLEFCAVSTLGLAFLMVSVPMFRGGDYDGGVEKAALIFGMVSGALLILTDIAGFIVLGKSGILGVFHLVVTFFLTLVLLTFTIMGNVLAIIAILAIKYIKAVQRVDTGAADDISVVPFYLCAFVGLAAIVIAGAGFWGLSAKLRRTARNVLTNVGFMLIVLLVILLASCAVIFRNSDEINDLLEDTDNCEQLMDAIPEDWFEQLPCNKYSGTVIRVSEPPCTDQVPDDASACYVQFNDVPGEYTVGNCAGNPTTSLYSYQAWEYSGDRHYVGCLNLEECCEELRVFSTSFAVATGYLCIWLVGTMFVAIVCIFYLAKYHLPPAPNNQTDKTPLTKWNWWIVGFILFAAALSVIALPVNITLNEIPEVQSTAVLPPPECIELDDADAVQQRRGLQTDGSDTILPTCPATFPCMDGMLTLSNFEAGIDCGGPCPNPCPVVTAAPSSAPTASPTGAPTMSPTDATCNDGVMNGLETDIDCGGGTCGGCAHGDTCDVDEDCGSGGTCNCPSGICVSKTCVTTPPTGTPTEAPTAAPTPAPTEAPTASAPSVCPTAIRPRQLHALLSWDESHPDLFFPFIRFSAEDDGGKECLISSTQGEGTQDCGGVAALPLDFPTDGRYTQTVTLSALFPGTSYNFYAQNIGSRVRGFGLTYIVNGGATETANLRVDICGYSATHGSVLIDSFEPPSTDVVNYDAISPDTDDSVRGITFTDGSEFARLFCLRTAAVDDFIQESTLTATGRYFTATGATQSSYFESCPPKDEPMCGATPAPASINFCSENIFGAFFSCPLGYNAMLRCPAGQACQQLENDGGINCVDPTPVVNPGPDDTLAPTPAPGPLCTSLNFVNEPCACTSLQAYIPDSFCQTYCFNMNENCGGDPAVHACVCSEETV